MKHIGKTYTLTYDPLDQQVEFTGVCRLSEAAEARQIFRYLAQIHDAAQGALQLNFRRLRYMNARGIKALAHFITWARRQNRRQIKLVAAHVVPWSVRELSVLTRLWSDVEIIIYDQNFYKSQNLIEDAAFIPLLRNQTRILWPLEKKILRQHGLEKGMKTADICCGCGDVPLLISRELGAGQVIGIDHSEAAIAYARNLRRQFHVQNASFQRGDATALMLEDDQFDFVLCRLSLQIFSRPEQILQELIRIAKPGGRVYAVCEDYDLVLGHPESDAIRHTYRLAAEYGDQMGMDLRSGKKLYGMLAEARLEDIRTDYLMVDTGNADREAFARVIESWQTFSVETIGGELGLNGAERGTLQAGYEAQLRAIRSPYGYTTWGLTACSGRKPV